MLFYGLPLPLGFRVLLPKPQPETLQPFNPKPSTLNPKWLELS